MVHSALSISLLLAVFDVVLPSAAVNVRNQAALTVQPRFPHPHFEFCLVCSPHTDHIFKWAIMEPVTCWSCQKSNPKIDFKSILTSIIWTCCIPLLLPFVVAVPHGHNSWISCLLFTEEAVQVVKQLLLCESESFYVLQSAHYYSM